MRDQQDDCGAGQDLTLTGRIGRLEKIARDAGYMLGDDMKAEGPQQHRNHIMSARVARGDAVRATPAPEQTAFEEIINQIQGSTDRVCMIADRLEKIGHRVLGPLNEGAEAAGDDVRKSPDGALDHTFLALNWLDQALSRLQNAATRMDRI